jgi:lipoprotein-anchoring transpeptidase ErfK/SrfK
MKKIFFNSYIKVFVSFLLVLFLLEGCLFLPPDSDNSDKITVGKEVQSMEAGTVQEKKVSLAEESVITDQKEREITEEPKEQTNTETTVTDTVKEGTEEDQPQDLFFNEPKESIGTFRIEIFKAERRLELYADDDITGRFPVALGFNPVGHKEKEGDGKTPEGEYYICYINRDSPYHIFYGLSYPNIEDAKRAYDSNFITEREFKSIENAINRKEIPNWYTILGGEVGIHGGGASRDWTLGCIALSNGDIDILDRYIGIGTKVFIRP